MSFQNLNCCKNNITPRLYKRKKWMKGNFNNMRKWPFISCVPSFLFSSIYTYISMWFFQSAERKYIKIFYVFFAVRLSYKTFIYYFCNLHKVYKKNYYSGNVWCLCWYRRICTTSYMNMTKIHFVNHFTIFLSSIFQDMISFCSVSSVWCWYFVFESLSVLLDFRSTHFQ